MRSFKYETMYGWHASMANFTNVAQSSSLHEILQFHNDTGRPGILELQGVFFAAAPKPMRGQVVKLRKFNHTHVRGFFQTMMETKSKRNVA